MRRPRCSHRDCCASTAEAEQLSHSAVQPHPANPATTLSGSIRRAARFRARSCRETHRVSVKRRLFSLRGAGRSSASGSPARPRAPCAPTRACAPGSCCAVPVSRQAARASTASCCCAPAPDPRGRPAVYGSLGSGPARRFAFSSSKLPSSVASIRPDRSTRSRAIVSLPRRPRSEMSLRTSV